MRLSTPSIIITIPLTTSKDRPSYYNIIIFYYIIQHHALSIIIIPVFVVDENIPKQEMFTGVYGGNVLGGDHVNNLLHLLENGEVSNNGREESCSNEK